MTAVQHTPGAKATLHSGESNVVVHELHPRHFHCFCYKLYYLSNFKDFNTIAPAC